MRTLGTNRFMLAALTAALVLATGWLLAGSGAPAPPPQSSETVENPLPEFQPSEKLPADSAVAFPTDI